jgi:hypothetical protein
LLSREREENIATKSELAIAQERCEDLNRKIEVADENMKQLRDTGERLVAEWLYLSRISGRFFWFQSKLVEIKSNMHMVDTHGWMVMPYCMHISGHGYRKFNKITPSPRHYFFK